ncbi:hypothetical protein P152DRAFT_109705 [Eremomyces bilateralis CBS 781.70]|uniref:Uncharacterized protein n=1 Tax=Eremomyces bilateralis CBS 781.70 TaxID=1392243 RepID=A0A6G1GD88_9PEZI|nr:uncharacterized protein P152DRAFT_109705 [Eremomyces bilateralis CBS 781.70]KAF1816065.1 hypothetical protein P152DRAFT_109705 [Eremomyces bilateralis CBS 781.70]
MPPSGRRGVRRRDVDQSDMDSPDMHQTPVRKRRKVNDDAPTSAAKPPKRVLSNQSTDTAKADYPDVQVALKTPMEKADAVVRALKVANYEVGASFDYANQILTQDTQTAYARISGRNWTFFVHQTRVIIGRPIKKEKKDDVGSAGGSAGQQLKDDEWAVDIDLGPEQQISRVHAEIAYEGSHWVLVVNGRNGLYLNEQKLERGNKVILESGNVISILGTQMMFLLPGFDQELKIHPTILKQAALGADDDETDGMNEDENMPPQERKRTDGLVQPRSAPAYAQQSSNFNDRRFDHLQKSPDTPIARGSFKSQNSPAYSRGLLLESTEDIDYSLDSAKDLKPPHSYAQMIGQAILSSPEEKCTLAKIYEFIKERYAFYRHSGGGWQNSIRHNLSLSKCFEKVARRTDEPGKGMKWQIVPEQREEFMKKSLTGNRKGLRPISSSGPTSPANREIPAMVAAGRLMEITGQRDGANDERQRRRGTNRSVTPPLASYPVANESFTPDRGSRPIQYPSSANTPATMTPSYGRGAHNGIDMLAEASGKAKHMGSAGYMFGHGGSNSPTGPNPFHTNPSNTMDTPLIARQHPLLAPPSTAHPPSKYLQLSSPAPFWNFLEMQNSTPARGGDIDPTTSPLKGRRASISGTDQDDADEGMQSENLPSERPRSADDATETQQGASVARATTTEPTRQFRDPNVTPTPKLSKKHNLDTAIAQPSSPPAFHTGDKSSPLPIRHVSAGSAIIQPATETNTVAPTADNENPTAPTDADAMDAMEPSPSRTISRTVSVGVGNQSNVKENGGNVASVSKLPSNSNPNINGNASSIPPGLGMGKAKPPMLQSGFRSSFGAGIGGMGGPMGRAEEEEEEGIDLAKGFETIGSFHRNMTANGIRGA